jgi:hypothetical protein
MSHMVALTRREREIMNALFALGNRASAEAIRVRLTDPPSDSSVRVMLARLEKKGYAVDYARLFTDIRECIDEAHRDGTILNEVDRSLPKYVDKDGLLAQTLHKLRSAGKRLFLLTNSRWPFTERMMTYGVGRGMEATDMPTIRAIARDTARSQYRFSSVVLGVVRSPQFQMRVKGNEPPLVASR